MSCSASCALCKIVLRLFKKVKAVACLAVKYVRARLKIGRNSHSENYKKPWNQVALLTDLTKSERGTISL